LKYLLDTSALIACVWEQHEFHDKAAAWSRGKQLVTCPISELGFLRIGTNARGLGLSMGDARELLRDFTSRAGVEFLPADMPCLGSSPRTSSQVTDLYLADLAEEHRMRFATFDGDINHPAVESV
jgi:predicted nucleic acid-binding protein